MRQELAVAAVNEYVDVVESQASPDRLQAVESRQHQALELARIANVSPFLVGAPTGSGMTYSNAQQAREQLLQDALPFAAAIEQTLSSAVMPRGRLVRFDREAALATVGAADPIPGGNP
jgi:phage portal protein BeeE